MFAGDLLAERARVTPDRLALVTVPDGERFTYADLNARANRAAATLQSIGIERGDRIAILAHNCVDYLDLFFAAWRLGAISVPLSTRATQHELTQIIQDCDAKALFASDDFAHIELPLPRFWSAAAQAAAFMESGSLRYRTPEDVVCLLYTSGTTGTPKGVMIPQRQILFNAYNTALNWDLHADDVSPVFTPIYHAGGLFAFLMPIFAAGGTIVLHSRFDVGEVWRTITAEKCTVVLGVPTIWKMLIDAPEFATANLDHVRWFISGGAPLPAYIIDAYQSRGIAFKQGFGMTEVGVNCFTMTVEESFTKRGSIGRPMLYTEVQLADVDEHGVGEMWIRGPHVSKGYWNNEAATRAAYGDDGWFRTGDLARKDDDGFFFIAGRRKEMFITGGVNVYPAEIEAALVSHPAVTDAAVIPIADETWGEVGVAFVVAKDVDSEALGNYLATRIARYKVPKRFVFIDALPRTPYGKVVKAQLRVTLDRNG